MEIRAHTDAGQDCSAGIPFLYYEDKRLVIRHNIKSSEGGVMSPTTYGKLAEHLEVKYLPGELNLVNDQFGYNPPNRQQCIGQQKAL